LPGLRASEDLQAKSQISVAEAFTAAARSQPETALHHARAALAHASAIGISAEDQRWAWPLAARAAHELGDTTIVGELLTLLDDCPPGHLAPMLQAECELVRARLAAECGQDAAASFAAAIGSLRELSTPYHLAHGLLDHAQYLTRLGEAEAAGKAITEARIIAEQLHCQPLVDRATRLTREGPGSRPKAAHK
jgi:hypothetical protein